MNEKIIHRFSINVIANFKERRNLYNKIYIYYTMIKNGQG